MKVFMEKINSTTNNTSLIPFIDTDDFLHHISVDCTIFCFTENKLKVLLLKYNELDFWALPGGYVYQDEDLRQAAARVLFERTQLHDLFLDQFHTFGRKGRTTDYNIHKEWLESKNIILPENHWLLKRFITVAYCSLIENKVANTLPKSLNENLEWFEVNELPTLIFDHERIIKEGLQHLRKNLDTQLVAYNLLSERFTMNDLQNLYETVLGEKFRRNNFQRKMLSLGTLERLEKFFDGSPNKAPYLYKFKESEINFSD